jgi:hypothetical protein
MSELEATEEQLRRARPAPATAWRHGLLRALRSQSIPPPRPERLWTWIGVAAAIGCALLLLAALLV